MKDLLLKIALAAWPYILKFLKVSAKTALEQVGPLALDLVRQYMMNASLTSDEKRRAVQAILRSKLPGIKDSVINAAIETAVLIAKDEMLK